MPRQTRRRFLRDAALGGMGLVILSDLRSRRAWRGPSRKRLQPSPGMLESGDNTTEECVILRGNPSRDASPPRRCFPVTAFRSPGKHLLFPV